MNKFVEVVRAKKQRNRQDESLLSVLLKTLENVAAERAGEPAPHNDAEIFAKVKEIKGEMQETANALSDEAASMTAELFPELAQKGALIPAGTRVNWGGVLKRAAVDLWDTEANNPDNAPTLWEDITYKDEYRTIPETITAGAAFSLGERGWWDGVLYESLIAANVYTPAAYPAGWKAVS